MYMCNNCKYKFEQPEELITTYESFYGISSLFESSTMLEMSVCPNCEDDDYVELQLCDNCEEWVEEAIEIEENYLCEQCYDELNAS